MIDLNFLKHLDRLNLIINKKVVSRMVGSRESKMSGKGLLFKDYRQYTQGEDYRSIDWKVYGRTDELFIKKYEEDRDMTIHIVLDLSSSMDFGKPMKKSEYGAMLAMGFAYLALKNNERFVVSTFSDKLTVLRARRGRKQLAAIITHLMGKKAEGQSNFDASLKQYKSLINSKSVIIIISDFLYEVDQIKNALQRLRKSEVILVQVLDEVEAKLNLEGEFKLRDKESSSVLRTFISPFLKKQYMSRLHEHDTKIKRICDEIGAKFYIADTSTPIYEHFYKLLRR